MRQALVVQPVTKGPIGRGSAITMPLPQNHDDLFALRSQPGDVLGSEFAQRLMYLAFEFGPLIVQDVSDRIHVRSSPGKLLGNVDRLSINQESGREAVQDVRVSMAGAVID
jgi:hypothetical protein